MIRRNLGQTNSRKRVPMKFSLKKKLVPSSKSNKSKNAQKDIPLFNILQKTSLAGLKQDKNFKVSRGHKRVEPMAFYNPNVSNTSGNSTYRKTTVSKINNSSTRTLETKHSLTNLNRKFSKASKKTIKRRLNQTTSIEDRSVGK